MTIHRNNITICIMNHDATHFSNVRIIIAGLLLLFCIASVVSFCREVDVKSTHHKLLHLVRSTSESLQSNDRVNDDDVNRTRNVRLIAPLLEYGYRPAVEEYENRTLSRKPLLLYLPGFDGTFLSPFLQFPECHTVFDVRCMTIGMDDRSTLDELKSDVLRYLDYECRYITANESSVKSSYDKPLSTLRQQQQQQQQRLVYIVGESFGGILAALVTISILEQSRNFCLKGITFINAATCFDRSRLAIEGPKVAKLNDWLYPFGLVGRLLPLFTDEHSVEQLLLIFQAKALPSVIDNECREAYMGRVAFSLPFVLSFMPKDTLYWRLTSWLEVGCARLAAKEKPLDKIKDIRALIIAGENDATLPSIAEAERLASILPNAVVHVVQGAGHASTCGSRVDLTALLRSRFDELQPLKASTLKSTPFRFWQQPKLAYNINLEGRTAMKQEAANGTGAYFGMQKRYDNASIGLSPLRYWSSEYYRKYIPRPDLDNL